MRASVALLAAVSLGGCAVLDYSDMEVSRGVYRVTVTGNRWARLETMETWFHGRAAEICSEKGFASYEWNLGTESVRGPSQYVVRPGLGGGAFVTESTSSGKLLRGDIVCTKRRPPTWRALAAADAGTAAPAQVLDVTTGEVLAVEPSVTATLLAASKRYVPVTDGRVAVVDDRGSPGFIRTEDFAQAKEAGYSFPASAASTPASALAPRADGR